MHNLHDSLCDVMTNVFFIASISSHSLNITYISKCNFILANTNKLFNHSVVLQITIWWCFVMLFNLNGAVDFNIFLQFLTAVE